MAPTLPDQVNCMFTLSRRRLGWLAGATATLAVAAWQCSLAFSGVVVSGVPRGGGATAAARGPARFAPSSGFRGRDGLASPGGGAAASAGAHAVTTNGGGAGDAYDNSSGAAAAVSSAELRRVHSRMHALQRARGGAGGAGGDARAIAAATADALTNGAMLAVGSVRAFVQKHVFAVRGDCCLR